MKRIFILFCFILSCFTAFKGFSQVLYENKSSLGVVFNPGLATGDEPLIVFDDINIPVSRIAGADSIGITLVKVGIGRVAGAPAVTVKVYITAIDPLPVSFDSLPAVPPVLLGSFDLPAGGLNTLLSVGDSINPFFKFKVDTGYVFRNSQTFFIGVSLSTPDPTNGWILTTGIPDSSEDIAFQYDPLNLVMPRAAFNFGGLPLFPEASFYAEAYGKVVLSSPLPVTLKDFVVAKRDQKNIITWRTETEANTSLFEIERSKDAANFQSIGQMPAAGNSNSPLSYQFVDNTPNKGINYYRLRTIDKNDNIAFSVIRNVRNDFVNAFNIYPNPVVSSIKADINSESPDKGIITIADISGRQVYYRQVQLLAGNNTFDIDIKNLPAGSYAVKINLSDNVVVKKITKQ